MLTGKRFRLHSPCLAIDETTHQRTSVTLPVDAIIDVIDGPKPDNPLIRAVWDQKWLLLLEQDVRERAAEVEKEDDESARVRKLMAEVDQLDSEVRAIQAEVDEKTKPKAESID
jgi:hypothetical protein